MTNFTDLVYDICAILESGQETTIDEIVLLTEDKPARIEAILELMISRGIVLKKEDGKEIKNPYPVMVDTYRHIKKEQDEDTKPKSSRWNV